jgi:chromosomal replication initiation ATPase DnaA
MPDNVWQEVLDRLRAALEPEEFRRWFDGTVYASDSGDQITVWVHSESVRRHILLHYLPAIDRALDALHRPDAEVRFVVAGYSDHEDDEE